MQKTYDMSILFLASLVLTGNFSMFLLACDEFMSCACKHSIPFNVHMNIMRYRRYRIGISKSEAYGLAHTRTHTHILLFLPKSHLPTCQCGSSVLGGKAAPLCGRFPAGCPFH